MKKDIKVEILREKNLENIKTMIEEKGKYEVLSYFSPFYNRRAYFKIDDMANISLKEYNPIILLFIFSEDITKLANYIVKYSYPEEKQNLKKIERSSNLNLKELRLNLMKTLVSGSLDFSKIFAKELYLRSEKDFFEILYNFALMGNPKDMKLFFVFALEKIFKEYKYDENLFFIIISYLSKIRDEFSTYINSSNEALEINYKNWNEDKEMYLKIFNRVVVNYSLKNINKFKNTLSKYFEDDFYLNTDLKEILSGVNL